MYAVLWRSLPGPAVAKAVLCLVLAVLAVAFCFLWLFPRIAPHLPFDQGAVTTPATSQTGPAPTGSTTGAAHPGYPGGT